MPVPRRGDCQTSAVSRGTRGRIRLRLTTVLACVVSVVAATTAAADGVPVLPTPGDVPADVQAAVEGPAREEVAAALAGAATGPGLTADCTPDRLGFGVVRGLFGFTDDVVAGRATTRPVEAQDEWLVPVLCGQAPIGVLWVARPHEGAPVEYRHHRWLAALGQDLVALRPDEIVVEHRSTELVFTVDPVAGSVRQLGNRDAPIIDGDVPLAQALSAVGEMDAELRADAENGPDDYWPAIIALGALAVFALVVAASVLRAVGEAVSRHRKRARGVHEHPQAE